MRFAGQWFDRDAGLVYNHNRWYDSRVGRYLRPDPLFEQGQWQDPYMYVQGNPYTFTDPMGLLTTAIGITINYSSGFEWMPGKGNFSFSLLFVVDGFGNSAVAASTGGGASTVPGASALFQVQSTGAMDLDSYFNSMTQNVGAGGTLGALKALLGKGGKPSPLYVGGEFIMGIPNGGKGGIPDWYTGWSGMFGLATPGFEAHTATEGAEALWYWEGELYKDLCR